MRSPPLWRSPNEKGEPKLALSPTTSPVFLFLALREAALRGNRLLSRARAGRHRRLLRDVRARRRDRARHETRVERGLRGKGRELDLRVQRLFEGRVREINLFDDLTPPFKVVLPNIGGSKLSRASIKKRVFKLSLQRRDFTAQGR